MKIAILSRNSSLHSIRRLKEEARKLRVECHVIDPLDCQIMVDGKNSQVFVGTIPAPFYDVVLPRIGASITDYGLAVVKHFEMLGMFVINSSKSIAESRDKLRCLQVLTQARLQVPTTCLTRNPKTLRRAVQAVRGMPVVLKVLRGTQGVGVMLVHSLISLGSVMDTLLGLDQDCIIQQFISEGAGRDYRVFVIGGKAVASMIRTAPEGEFRSNIHRGGEGKPISLPPSYEKAAIRAAKTLGLEIAGVDLMQSAAGPLVIEVNSSPGFEGIEKATGKNIAGAIIKHMVSQARRRSRKRRS